MKNLIALCLAAAVLLGGCVPSVSAGGGAGVDRTEIAVAGAVAAEFAAARRCPRNSTERAAVAGARIAFDIGFGSRLSVAQRERVDNARAATDRTCDGLASEARFRSGSSGAALMPAAVAAAPAATGPSWEDVIRLCHDAVYKGETARVAARLSEMPEAVRKSAMVVCAAYVEGVAAERGKVPAGKAVSI